MSEMDEVIEEGPRGLEIQAAVLHVLDGRHHNISFSERTLDLEEPMTEKYVKLDDSCLSLLHMAIDKLSLSARAYTRILKVSRTIADLEGSENIKSEHIAEAIQYRELDRGDWAERGI